MKILKLAALVALAAVPVLMIRKPKPAPLPAQTVDSDHIFDLELSTADDIRS